MEMVRLFQLQLEHYEKVEGAAISLEGKANQLSMMVRSNLPASAAGAWSSCRSSPATTVRRGVRTALGLRRRRAAGTRRSEYVATGSGSLHAGTVIKVGYRSDLGR